MRLTFHGGHKQQRYKYNRKQGVIVAVNKIMKEKGRESNGDAVVFDKLIKAGV